MLTKWMIFVLCMGASPNDSLIRAMNLVILPVLLIHTKSKMVIQKCSCVLGGGGGGDFITIAHGQSSRGQEELICKRNGKIMRQ